MRTAGIASSIIPQQTTQHSIELKKGQMIYGKVLKIHSNQTAEISLGQNKVTAVLDAPIALGERYWFQVQINDDQTMLKVLPNNGTNQNMKEMSIQLLQHFSLPQTKESLTLAHFLVKNQIPFTKEQFIQSLQWLNNSGNLTKNMQLLKMMNDFSLPFSENVFRSLVSFDNGVSLQNLFNKLDNLLAVPKSGTEASIKALLSQFMATDAEKLGETGLQKLVASWLTSDGAQKANISSVLQNVGFLPKNENTFLQQVLKQLGDNNTLVLNQLIKDVISSLNQLQKNPDLVNFEQLSRIIHASQTTTGDHSLWNQLQKAVEQVSVTVAEASRDSVGKPIANELRLQTAYQQLAKATIAYASSESRLDRVQLFRFLQLLYHAGQQEGSYESVRVNMANMLTHAAEGKPLPYLSDTNEQLILKLLQTEITELTTPKSEVIANEIKQLIRQFGLGLEHYLANVDKGASIKEAELLTLKPLLMQLVNETQSLSVKEQADQLLHKITAQQILSQSSGPIQHFIVQIPLSFQGHYTESTLQWSGRKDDKGNIDPAFCRVLFYLQLENINETIVDMVVQNRVLKITVINENYKEIKESAMPLIAQVKANLAEIGYQVSGFSFIPPFEQKNESKSKSEVYDKAPYSGVDIKI